MNIWKRAADHGLGVGGLAGLRFGCGSCLGAVPGYGRNAGVVALVGLGLAFRRPAVDRPGSVGLAGWLGACPQPANEKDSRIWVSWAR